MKIGQQNFTASVILPVYNAEKYLDLAIESVLSQTFKNFELLLLNDGSTDSSLERLEYYAAQDSRCRLYSWANQGLIYTLNEGICLSKTNIIIRMDADDICVDHRFEKQIAYLSDHPEYVAVGSKVLLIDEDGFPISEFERKLEHEAIDNENLKGMGSSICHPSSAIRKEAIIRVGGYQAQFQHAEDLDLFLKLAEVGRLANLPEVLLKYRQHINSIGYSHSEAQLNSSKKAVIDTYKRRNLEKPEFLFARHNDFEDPTIADVHRKWAWWALGAGNLKTARKHTFKAMRLTPLNKENIKLLACVLRGY